MSSAGDEVAAISLKIEMLRRGLSAEDLAEIGRISLHQMSRELNRGVKTRSLRWRIEEAFGFPLTLWSPVPEIRFRKWFIREHGADPRGLELSELKAFSRRVGAGSPKVRRREDWFQLLVRWFSKNPQRNERIQP